MKKGKQTFRLFTKFTSLQVDQPWPSFHLSILSLFHFFSWLFGIKFTRHITPLAPWRGAGGEALFILFLVYVFAFEPWRLFEHPSLVVVLVVGQVGITHSTLHEGL